MVKQIEFGKLGSPTLGFISVVEAEKNVSFKIKRVYWTYFTPNEVQRGGHAHKNLEQLIFAVSGRIEIETIDKNGERGLFVLDKPNIGLYLPPLVWRDIRFSHSSVLLCLASDFYLEEDYIRSYPYFLELINKMK